MENEVFKGRLGVVRAVFVQGPVAELSDLAKRAGIASKVLHAGYRSVIGMPLRERIAQAAAELLELDPKAMRRWLVEGLDEPKIEERLRWLPTQYRCTACKGYFDKKDRENFVEPIRRCKVCINAGQRYRRNPKAARYEELLAQRLPEIKAVCPPLAAAVQQTLHERQTPTYERLSKRALISIIEVTKILKGLGLDKRKLPLGVVMAVMLGTSPLKAETCGKWLLPASRRWRWLIPAILPIENDNAPGGLSSLEEVAEAA